MADYFTSVTLAWCRLRDDLSRAQRAPGAGRGRRPRSTEALPDPPAPGRCTRMWPSAGAAVGQASLLPGSS